MPFKIQIYLNRFKHVFLLSTHLNIKLFKIMNLLKFIRNSYKEVN